LRSSGGMVFRRDGRWDLVPVQSPVGCWLLFSLTELVDTPFCDAIALATSRRL
jgi:hypothetical protein